MTDIGQIVGKLKGLSLLNELSVPDIDDQIEAVKRAIEMLNEELSTLEVLRSVKVVMQKREGTYKAFVSPVVEKPKVKDVYIADRILSVWGDPDARHVKELVDLLPEYAVPSIRQALLVRKDLFARVSRGVYTRTEGKTQQEIEWLQKSRS